MINSKIAQLVAALTASLQQPVRRGPDRSDFRPTGAALRNPNDPIQADRIEAAKCKRARKASLAQRNYNRCIAGGI